MLHIVFISFFHVIAVLHVNTATALSPAKNMSDLLRIIARKSFALGNDAG
jgi:hypothetical protein